MKSSLDYILYARLLLIAGVTGSITDGPINAVAEVGGKAIFNCTSSTTLQNWVLSAERPEFGTPSEEIVVNCMIQSGYTTHYEVDRPGGSNNKCSLIVKDTTLQQAGVYTCTDAVYGPSALLTVIDPKINIAVNKPNSDVVESENVTISCSLRYNGTQSPAPSLQPYFNWINSSKETFYASYSETTSYLAKSQITVTAGRQNISSFKCSLFFSLSNYTSGYASNTPTTNLTFSTPIVEVLYPPTSVEINRTSLTEQQCFHAKSVSFTCHAASNPPPSYEWMDLTPGNKTSGQFKQVSHIGTYQCVATTTIRNKTYSANASTTVLGCEIPGNVTVTVNGGGKCNNGVCDCGGHDTMDLECHASGIPPPYYTWRGISFGMSRSVNGSKITVYNGTYTCTAFNDFEGKTYNTSVVVDVTGCLYTPPTTKASKVSSGSTPGVIIPAVVVPCWVLLNLIAMSVFLVYYNGRDPNGKHEHKKMLNNSFSWLRLMLPCFNESSDAGCSQCLWVFLFVLMSVAVGVIVFPILIIRANCTFPNDADKLSTASTPTSTTNEMELRFSEIGDTRDDGGTAQGHSRPSGVRRDPSPYEEFSTTTSHPSKLHPQGNTDMKQKQVPTTPLYTEVNKAKPKTDVQESNAYSVPYYTDNISNIPKATVPLPPIKAPHQTSVPHPNSPVYSELNVVSESNSRRPVQFLAEQTDPQYAQLKDT